MGTLQGHCKSGRRTAEGSPVSRLAQGVFGDDEDDSDDTPVLFCRGYLHWFCGIGIVDAAHNTVCYVQRPSVVETDQRHCKCT